MATDFAEIAETFEFLDDWEDRYRYVIDLGKAMPDLDAAHMQPATKVDGCASQVWLVPNVTGSGPQSKIEFLGGSDAMIVKGLIAILISLMSGKTAAQIKATDALGEFAKLGLDQHLSAQRSNGLRAMIERVSTIAERACNS